MYHTLVLCDWGKDMKQHVGCCAFKNAIFIVGTTTSNDFEKALIREGEVVKIFML